MGWTDYLTDILSTGSPSTTSSMNAEDAERVDVVYECRDCGTTVSSSAFKCPSCEGAGIAEYIIE